MDEIIGDTANISATESIVFKDNELPISNWAITQFKNIKWNEKCEFWTSWGDFVKSHNNFECDFPILSNYIEWCWSDTNWKVNSNAITFLLIWTPISCNDPQFKVWISNVLGKIVNKFKEKKEKWNDEILSWLTGWLKYTMNYEELLRPIADFTNDKSLTYKLNIGEFLFVNLRKVYIDLLVKIRNDVIGIFSVLAKESNLEIKNCALSSWALIRKRIGRKKFMECDSTMREINNELLSEIEDVMANINYDTKYDQGDFVKEESDNGDEEEVEVEEVEEVSEVSEEEDKQEEIWNNNRNDILIKEEEVKDNRNCGKLWIEVDEIIKEEIMEESPKKKHEIFKEKQSNGENNFEIKTEVLSSITKETPEIVIQEEEAEEDKIPDSKSVTISNQSIANTNQPLESPKNNTTSVQEQPNISIPTSSINDFEKKLAEALQKEEEEIKNSDMLSTTQDPLPKPKKKSEIDIEYTEKIKAIFSNSEMYDLLDSLKWDAKKKGFTLLNEWLIQQKEKISTSNQTQNIIFTYLKIKANNFKETNFNLLKELFSCYSNWICISFDKTLINQWIKAFYEKISDAKLKDSLISLLNTIIDNFGTEYLISLILQTWDVNANKKLKIQVAKEYAIYIQTTIEDYGIENLNIKNIVDFSIFLANHSNAQARSASFSLICTMYKHYGNDIKVLIKDVKQSTLQIIDQELSKVTVIEKKDKPKKSTNVGNNEINGVGINKELIPRVDISKQITKKILADINDGKWAEKKESVEWVILILKKANKKILPIGWNPLFTLIKSKLNDGNKNLVRLIIQLLTHLIESLGPGLKIYTKMIGNPWLFALADKQSSLREDCCECIEQWILCYNFESIVTYFPICLKNDNYEMRSELLKILLKHRDKLTKNWGDTFNKEITPSLLNCWQDKNNIIRNQVEEIISITLTFIPAKQYYTNIQELKPAIANSLNQIWNKLCSESNIALENEDIQSKDKETQEVKAEDNKGNNVNQIVKTVSKVTRNKANIPNNTSKTSLLNTTSKTYVKDNLNSGKSQILAKTNKNQNNILSIKQTNSKSLNKTPVKKSHNSRTSCSVILNTKSTFMNNKIKITDKKEIFLPHNKAKLSTKEMREIADRKVKFNWENPNFEYINKLKELFKFWFIPEQNQRLFAVDIQKNIQGFIWITSYFEENQAIVIDNWDWILKYFGWRITTNNNTSLVRTFYDFMESCFNYTENNEYIFNETEINIWLNVFADKLSNSNSIIKDTTNKWISKLILQVGKTKILPWLVHICQYKTVKNKCEIIDIWLLIFNDEEITPKMQAKTAKTIFKIYVGGDMMIRNKLIPIAKWIADIIGDEIWKYVNEWSEREKNDWYDKIKPDDESEEEEDKNDEQQIEMDKEDTTGIKNDENIFKDEWLNDKTNTNSEIKTDKSVKTSGITGESANNNINNTLVNSTQTKNETKTDWISKRLDENNNDEDDYSFHMIQTDPSSETSKNKKSNPFNNSQDHVIISSIDSLVVLFKSLADNTSKKNEYFMKLHLIIVKNYDINKTILVSNSDFVITSFINYLNELLEANPLELKAMKYTMTILSKVSSLEEIMKAISFSVHQSLINTMLTTIINEKLTQIENGKEKNVILTSLNLTIRHVLEICDLTNSICIFLEIHKKNQNQGNEAQMARMSVNCLIKTVESMKGTIRTWNIERILNSIHEFFIEYEKLRPDWQMNTHTDQMVISSIQILWKELVYIRGESIQDDYSKSVELSTTKDKNMKRWIKNLWDMLWNENNNSICNKSNINSIANNERAYELSQTSTNKPNEPNQNISELNSSDNSNTTLSSSSISNKEARVKSFGQIQKKWNEVSNKSSKDNK